MQFLQLLSERLQFLHQNALTMHWALELHSCVSKNISFAVNRLATSVRSIDIFAIITARLHEWKNDADQWSIVQSAKVSKTTAQMPPAFFCHENQELFILRCLIFNFSIVNPVDFVRINFYNI